MEDTQILLNNLEKLHTTDMGLIRIKKNLLLNESLTIKEVIDYCINIITNNSTLIYKKGKNFYCILNNIKIAINSYNYGIITAHIVNKRSKIK